MLNPSTADSSRDDPTIRRCIGFAQAWGYGGVEVVNLFGLRATKPWRLRHARDPVGRDNDAHVGAVASSVDAVVIAWGVHGALGARDETTLALLSRRTRLLALGWTRAGQPRHPLYLRRDVRPIALGGVRRSAA
ncbi:MAG TPA: DUF1643 domain-containing protein [Candidatus Limnocylindria bacterium]|nr:DUF1643 domain-containing protein [Candidatus Limnocylindria bacterium]